MYTKTTGPAEHMEQWGFIHTYFCTIIITLFLKKGKIKTIKYLVVPTWFDNVPPGLIPRYHSPPPTVWKASLLRGGSGYFLPRMQRIAFGFRAVKPSSRTLSRSSSALWHVEYHYCSIDCEVFKKGSPNIQIIWFSIHKWRNSFTREFLVIND